MNIINITNIDRLAGVNFTFKEYWLTAKQDYTTYECILKSLQVIREWLGDKWSITSSYRPNDPISMPKAHRIQPCAIDSCSTDRTKWAEHSDKLRNEFKNWQTSGLVKDILMTGCNVIIIEPTCLHLHYREDKLHNTMQYGKIYIGEWNNGKDIAYSFHTL